MASRAISPTSADGELLDLAGDMAGSRLRVLALALRDYPADYAGRTRNANWSCWVWWA